jgi:phosphoribosylaminoimidazole-succinocarboxamide synthase
MMDTGMDTGVGTGTETGFEISPGTGAEADAGAGAGSDLGASALRKGALIYEGKAKKVYETADAAYCIVSYKDDATAQNGLKKGQIAGKGAVNNKMSNQLFEMLESNGVRTHFARELSDRETCVRRVEIVPLEVIVRNIAAGSFAKRFGAKEGSALLRPTLEYCLKDDALGDPMINDSHILALGLCAQEDLDFIANAAFRVNALLKAYMREIGVTLVDFKLEFGKAADGRILLADEISPDTCRFWDSETGKKLDKDRFRNDMGEVEEAYQTIFGRLAKARERARDQARRQPQDQARERAHSQPQDPAKRPAQSLGDVQTCGHGLGQVRG